MNSKRLFGILMLVIQSVLLSSCCTRGLWRSVDPSNHYLWVAEKDITKESLIVNKIEYKEFDDPNFGKGYLIEKSCYRKLGDYTLVSLISPITITIDGVTFIVKETLKNPPVRF